MAERPRTAAALLRAARQQAQLSQRQLAARAGVAQSVVSAYETGHRKPALETLQRLIDATGHRLDIDLVALADQPTLPGDLGRRVQRHRDEIVRTAAGHGARNVRIFGSVARGDERAGSDVDVLVDLASPRGLFTLMRLERDLAALLGVEVDVIPADSLKPEVRASAEHDMVVL